MIIFWQKLKLNSTSDLVDSNNSHFYGTLSLYQDRPFAFSCTFSCNHSLTTHFIANHNTKEVELFDFGSNKWETKPEWSYPFNDGKG